MNFDNGKQQPKNGNEEIMRRRKELVISSLKAMSALFFADVTTELTVLYAELLSDLTEKQIEHGFREAARYFKPEYGRKIPSPVEIREWAERLPIDDAVRQSAIEREEIDPANVPKGWTAFEVLRARVTMRLARQKASESLPQSGKPTREEIQGWFDEGVRKQRAVIAALKADPKWVEMAQRLGGFPGLSAKKMPTTEPQRDAFETEEEWRSAQRKWASRKAKEMGWGGSVEEFNRDSAAIEAKNEATMQFIEK